MNWLNCLEREHDNLRGALAWVVKTEDTVSAQRLAGALNYFWRIRGHSKEGLGWLEAALALPTSRRTPEPNAWQARALLGASWLAEGKDPSASQSRLEQGLAIYRELGDKAGIALAFWLR